MNMYLHNSYLRNDMDKSSHKNVPRSLENALNKSFSRFLIEHDFEKYGTVAGLSRAARLPTSAIQMVLAGERPMSARTALYLAQLFKPELKHSDLQAFAETVLREANGYFGEVTIRPRKTVVSLVRTSSVADRVRMNGTVVGGIVVSEPFVHPSQAGGGGFAIELFRLLARFLGADPLEQPVSFADLKASLQSNKIDLVITALLPTHRRSEFMSFSRPLPFLRVSLSALVRKTLHPLPRVDNLLAGDGESLKSARLMLVEGEAGEEYARILFNQDFRRRLEAENRITLVPGRSSKDVAEGLLKQDLLVADVATCHAVMGQPGIPTNFEPMTDKDGAPALKLGTKKYPSLASYPIVFGFKKQDESWKQAIGAAFEGMLGEGIRGLTSLYRKCLDIPRDSIAPYLVGKDDTVSNIARLFFESEIPEILTKRLTEEDELERRQQEEQMRLKIGNWKKQKKGKKGD